MNPIFLLLGVLALIAFFAVPLFLLFLWGKRKIRPAQVMWASVVQRLGGQELSTRGVSGSRAFRLGEAVLAIVVLPSVDSNIVGNSKSDNSYKSQITVPVQRPVWPFSIFQGKYPGGIETHKPLIDKAWTLVPLLDASPNEVIAQFDDEVERALSVMGPGFCKICTGGHNIVAVYDSLAMTESELEALLFVCRRLAGEV